MAEMLDGFVVFLFYMGLISGFCCLAGLLEWLWEHVPFCARLLNRLMDFMGLDIEDEDEEEDLV